VDRSFSIKGFGSVVTGTLIAGTLREGDDVAVLPQGIRTRIRGLEVFNQPTALAYPGQRTAVNLQGVEAGAIERGNLLTVPGVLEPSYLLDVALETLPLDEAALRDLSRVRFHHGTLEAMARVKIFDGATVPPGGHGFAQLRLETALAALPGDRFILRRYSPPITIGGGTILHTRPPKMRRATPDGRERLERLSDPSPVVRLGALVDEAGASGVDAHTLRSLTGLEPEETARLLEAVVRGGQVVSLPGAAARYVAAGAWNDLSRRVESTLAEYHRKEPLKEGFPREELRTRLFAHLHPDVFKFMMAALSQRGGVRVEKDRVSLATHRVALTPGEQALVERIEARYSSSGTNPPDLDEVITALGADPSQARRLFHLLLLRGRLVRIPDGKVFHARALEELKNRLWEQRARAPVIDISEFKELSGTSRKNAIPLLEHFDQTRVTRREGNKRLILPPPADRSSA
jgi:selenocysteine-specific elongation factor